MHDIIHLHFESYNALDKENHMSSSDHMIDSWITLLISYAWEATSTVPHDLYTQKRECILGRTKIGGNAMEKEERERERER